MPIEINEYGEPVEVGQKPPSEAVKVPNFYYTKEHIKGENISVGDWTYGRPMVRFKQKQAKLNIGKYCSIAGGVRIYMGGEHITENTSTYPFKVLREFWTEADAESIKPSEDVTIGNDVWIGTQAVIMPGVTIGDGAVIGASSVVASDVAPYTIVAGNPAREIRKRFDDEAIAFLLDLKWWEWDDAKVARNVNLLSSPDIYKLKDCI